MTPQSSLHSPEMTGAKHRSMWLPSVVCGLPWASVGHQGKGMEPSVARRSLAERRQWRWGGERSCVVPPTHSGALLEEKNSKHSAGPQAQPPGQRSAGLCSHCADT